jgi:aspartate aminotransferase
MGSSFAARTSVVKPSATLAISARATELKAQGRDIFAFGVGEPDFEPPAHVLLAAKEAIERGASKYTAVTGLVALKEAIAEAATGRRGYTPDPSEVVISVGAKHALFNLALALYEPGDEVIVPSPHWVSYPEQVRMLGAEPVLIDTDESTGFRLGPDALKQALSPKTKALILCSPSNPTGAAYTREQLKALLDVIADHSDAWFIVDEIYADLLYDGFVHASPRALRPDMTGRIAIVDGVSKSYAMTGWRIGWSIAPKSLSAILDVMQGQSTTNATTVSQYAAIAALRGPQEPREAMRATFESRRNLMCGLLNQIEGIRCPSPEGAFYLFANCTELLGKHGTTGILDSDVALARFFLEEAGVACVPGSGFGKAGYIRFSYATSDARIIAGVDALRNAVARLT